MNRRLPQMAVPALCVLLSACGGGGADDAPPFPEFTTAAGACEEHWSLHARLLSRATDSNADGVADVLVAQDGDTPEVQLRSGKDGKLLWARESSRRVSQVALEDLDGDGSAELLLSTVIPPQQGECEDNCGSTEGAVELFHLEALTVSSGALRWSRAPDPEGSNVNSRFAVLDDQDGDGVRDLVLGAHYSSTSDPSALRIVSGATGQLLRTLAPPPESAESYGEHIVVVPDLDGDSRWDLLVTDTRGPASRYAKGRITALSSATGAILWERNGDAVEGALLYGEGLALLRRPGSAIPDVLVGAHNSAGLDTEPQPGWMEVLDGRTGARRLFLAGRQAFEHFGIFVSDVGDLDGDGAQDFGVAAPTPGLPVAVGGQGGRFAIHSGSDGAVLLDVQEVIGEEAFSNGFGFRVYGLEDRDSGGRSTVVTHSHEGTGAEAVPITLAFRCSAGS